MTIWRATVLAGALLVSCGEPPPASDVVAVARSFPDGGGYDKKWQGHGVPRDVVFQGATILSRAKSSEGTYCCGFTFLVAMTVAEPRGLLEGKAVAQVRQFQQEWFGATSASRRKQCALAVTTLGIGREVPFAEAAAGDFVQLWRTDGSGHSVVFLGWVEEGGRRVGLRYRSSQGSTNGIGDCVEYFAGAEGRQGRVDSSDGYAARLSARRARE